MSENGSGRQVYWRPSAVLAWICTRDLGAVDSASEENSFLQVTVAVSDWERRTGSDALMGPVAARHQLQNLCREGQLTATGILHRRASFGDPSDRGPVPIESWCEPGAGLQERRRELELWFSPRSNGDHWTALLYRRTAVQDCWPASQSALTIAAETKAGQWLATEVAKGPPVKPKRNYEVELKELYSIGHRAFLRAWDAATLAPGAEAWRKSGRKRKKPEKSNH